MSTARFSPSRRTWWGGWSLLALLAVGTVAYSAPPYLSGDSSQSNIPLNPDVALHYLYLGIHTLPASLLLLLGPIQFVPTLRNKYRKLHRVIGRIYMISIVIAAAAAILSATYSVDGFPAQAAFYLLTAAWLYSLAQAYRAIRKGQIQLHRIWMIRNYALSFAAVLLRGLLLLGLAAQSRWEWLTFEDIYTTSAWAAILISAGAAEWFIVQRTLNHLAHRRQGTTMSSKPAAATDQKKAPAPQVSLG